MWGTEAALSINDWPDFIDDKFGSFRKEKNCFMNSSFIAKLNTANFLMSILFSFEI